MLSSVFQGFLLLMEVALSGGFSFILTWVTALTPAGRTGTEFSIENMNKIQNVKKNVIGQRLYDIV